MEGPDRKKTCAKCGGSGKVADAKEGSKACDVCGGSGKVPGGYVTK